MRGRPRCRRLGANLPHFMRRGSAMRVDNYNEYDGPHLLRRAARGGAPPAGALSRRARRTAARPLHGAGHVRLDLARDRGIRRRALRPFARPRARGRHVLHALLPRAAGPPRRVGLPQPLLPPGRSRIDHRAPQAATARRGGRDDRGRPGDAALGRMSLRVRSGADDAGRRPLRDEPDAGEDRSHPRGARVTDEKILTRNFHRQDSHTLDGYRATGGYQAWPKAQAMEPAAIVEDVKASNLRGLGGAGFPTGTKWSFIPKTHTGPVYLVINADEGEPGTFKDRYLLERDPHALIEGMLIAARAIRCTKGFVYIRGEYVEPWRRFSAAVKEAYDAGLLGQGFDVVVHRGAGAYICGEETGLLSSLEGKKGWPKIKPPFPAIKGAFGQPTIVNNVETLCCVPPIVTRGAEWFAGLGTKTQGGTRMYSVSGRVKQPGVYEASVSITLRQLIERAGGVSGNRVLKGVVPGGSSAPI